LGTALIKSERAVVDLINAKLSPRNFLPFYQDFILVDPAVSGYFMLKFLFICLCFGHIDSQVSSRSEKTEILALKQSKLLCFQSN
jgi:hypothetical protein